MRKLIVFADDALDKLTQLGRDRWRRDKSTLMRRSPTC